MARSLPRSECALAARVTLLPLLLLLSAASSNLCKSTSLGTLRMRCGGDNASEAWGVSRVDSRSCAGLASIKIGCTHGQGRVPAEAANGDGADAKENVLDEAPAAFGITRTGHLRRRAAVAVPQDADVQRWHAWRIRRSPALVHLEHLALRGGGDCTENHAQHTHGHSPYPSHSPGGAVPSWYISKRLADSRMRGGSAELEIDSSGRNSRNRTRALDEALRLAVQDHNVTVAQDLVLPPTLVRIAVHLPQRSLRRA